MIQFISLLIAGVVLILFAHQYIPPEIVFTATIASLAGIVGARIASNGYVKEPPAAINQAATDGAEGA